MVDIHNHVQKKNLGLEEFCHHIGDQKMIPLSQIQREGRKQNKEKGCLFFREITEYLLDMTK